MKQAQTTNSDQLDYREWLKRAFSERCRSNPRYSLRAFARDLKLSPAAVSYILNGKKGLSRASAEQVAQALGLSSTETELFCESVEAQHGRNPVTRTLAKTRLAQLKLQPEVRSLQLDAFQVISDWYHLAILQLVQVEGFQDSPKWIADQLGIHPKEASAAIDRLLRMELLIQVERGYSVQSEVVMAPDGISSEAIRKFHRQILEKATQALTTQSLEERYFNTTVLPVRIEDLPRAKAKIKKFHEDFDREFTPSSEPGERVYALAVQLFALQTSKGNP